MLKTYQKEIEVKKGDSTERGPVAAEGEEKWQIGGSREGMSSGSAGQRGSHLRVHAEAGQVRAEHGA